MRWSATSSLPGIPLLAAADRNLPLPFCSQPYVDLGLSAAPLLGKANISARTVRRVVGRLEATATSWSTAWVAGRVDELLHAIHCYPQPDRMSPHTLPGVTGVTGPPGTAVGTPETAVSPDPPGNPKGAAHVGGRRDVLKPQSHADTSGFQLYRPGMGSQRLHPRRRDGSGPQEPAITVRD